MLKIRRSTNGSVVFRLSGRIDVQDVLELRRLLASENTQHGVALDLENVTLVDRDGIAFLASCEAKGIRLENCPAHVREWLEEERGSTLE